MEGKSTKGDKPKWKGLLPERVLGRAGAFWMKSGVAIGPIFSLTEKEKKTTALR